MTRYCSTDIDGKSDSSKNFRTARSNANPKTGTVKRSEKAIERLKRKGEYRVDNRRIHSPVGKVSFDEAKLLENTRVLINAVIKAKPTTAKGRYLKKINLAATMSPGVLLDELAFV